MARREVGYEGLPSGCFAVAVIWSLSAAGRCGDVYRGRFDLLWLLSGVCRDDVELAVCAHVDDALASCLAGEVMRRLAPRAEIAARVHGGEVGLACNSVPGSSVDYDCAET